MDPKTSTRRSATMLLVTFVLLILIGLSGLYSGYITYTIRNDAELINKLGVIRGSVQRLILLESNDMPDDTLIESIRERIREFEGSRERFFGTESPVYSRLSTMIAEWEHIQSAIMAYRRDPSESTKRVMINHCEDMWRVTNEIVYLAQAEAESKLRNYNGMFVFIVINIALTVAILVWLRKYVQGTLEYIALYDSLTNLVNRGRHDVLLRRETERAKRYSRPLSLLVLDIDHFKRVNDTYGHAVGDQVLRELGRRIRQQIRSSDNAARIGGEEFAVIAPETTLKEAGALAEKLRRTVADSDFNKVGRITISVGVAQLSEDDDADTLFKKADGALYEAKHLGRNRVEKAS